MIGMRKIWGIAETISVMHPGAKWILRDNDYEKLEWFSEDIEKPTLIQISAKQTECETAEPIRVLREIRDWYLQQSDWTQGADIRALRGVDWCNAWNTYRQQLRDLPDNVSGLYFDEMNMLHGYTLPSKPNIV